MKEIRYCRAGALESSGSPADGFLLFSAPGSYRDAGDRALSLAVMITDGADLERALAIVEDLTPEEYKNKELAFRARFD